MVANHITQKSGPVKDAPPLQLSAPARSRSHRSFQPFYFQERVKEGQGARRSMQAKWARKAFDRLLGWSHP